MVSYASYFVGFAGGICNMQFGNILFNDIYAEDDKSDDYYKNSLSLQLIIVQVIVIPLTVGLGAILDRVKIWPIVLIQQLCGVGALILFIVNIPS